MIGRKSRDIYNRECHIIGIGIDNYRTRDLLQLRNCKADVERFINKVCTSFETFSPEFVTRLYDKAATKEVIEITIKNKIGILKSHQNLIIYFAGHGVQHNKSVYLVPQDAKSKYENPNNSKLISHNEIFNWIDNKSPWHIVIILDCCHGGTIMNAKRASIEKYTLDEYLNDNLGTADYQQVKDIKSAWVITSGSDAQTVNDGNEDGSPFSQALMKILNGAVTTNTPIPVAKLGTILKYRFPKKYKQRPDYKHLNDIKGYKQTGGEFVFEPISRRLKQELGAKLEVVPLPELEVVPLPELEVVPLPELEVTPLPELEVTPLSELEVTPLSESRVTEIDIQPPFGTLNDSNRNKKNEKFLLVIFVLALITIVIILFLKHTNNSPLPPQPLPQPSVDTLNPLPTTHEADVIEVDTSEPKPITKPPYIKKNVRFDEDKDNSDSVNIVFVGSFQFKQNAEALLEKLKKIGYQKAEIVMKENLPYAVVVTGFHQSNISAKSEVKKLKRNGIEVYYAESDYAKIYRK